ncbi:MAG: hypothetical protein MSA38_00135 [Bacteroidales bacterium]|nr:hypothetical protein [Bacteroidales bacterium]
MKNKKIYTPPTFEPFTTEELMEDIGIVRPSAGGQATTDETLSKKNNIDMEMLMEEEEDGSNPHYKNYWDLN